ncbi:MAG: hypothetical protein KJ645_14120 [Planctomycetes bacterium]|nr:hypothetical protein [Planctomycetota bacterium]
MRKSWMVLICGLLCAGLFAQEGSPDPKRHAAALKVIGMNLDAVGGKDRLQAVQTLALKAGQSISLIKPKEMAAYSLKKPDFLKRESPTDVLLITPDKKVFNIGDGETPIPPEQLVDTGFRVRLYNQAFSLLLWEAYFDKAEYLGKKKYDDHEEYVVLIPGAEGGEDVTVHIDKETCLIDRVVFKIPHERANYLTSITRLRDYQIFDGIMFPTTIHFETVGWKGEEEQFVIEDVKVNPGFEDEVFEQAKMDFGFLTCENGVLEGEVRSTQYGLLFSNVADDHMKDLGVEDGDWVEISVNGRSIKVQYDADYNLSPEEAAARDYKVFCRHPRASYPRLLLLPVPGQDLTEELTFAVGDRFKITKTEPETTSEENNG